MTDSPTHVRYQSLAWLILAAALAYFCRNAVGVAESSIREDLGLTLKQSGMFWTVAGANQIMALRCNRRSGRFEDYWESRARAA